MSQVSADIQQAYAEQYDETTREWRRLGAKHKALNIRSVTGGKRFGKVLEVGSGDGAILAELEKLNFAEELYSLEISDSGLAQINARDLPSLKEARLFDGYECPLPRRRFRRRDSDARARACGVRADAAPRASPTGAPPRNRSPARLPLPGRPKSEAFHGLRPHQRLHAFGAAVLAGDGRLRGRARPSNRDRRETLHFNAFQIRGQSRSFANKLRIDAEYYVRKALLDYGGEKRADKFCNAYTVFTKRTKEKPVIFGD